MKFVKGLAEFLPAFALTAFLIGGAVVITLGFRPLYYKDVDRLQIPQESGYSKEEILENYNALIDYNMKWEDSRLEFPSLPMSDNGRTHFAEVKDIFDIFKWMLVVGGAISLVGAFLFLRKKEAGFLLKASVTSAVLPVVLAILAAACWDKLFVWFHELFFDNDFWQFSEIEDPVILILPDTFFLHCALMIFGLVFLGSILCLVLYLILRKRKSAVR